MVVNLHFPVNTGCRTFFHMLFAISVPSLVTCLLKSLAHFWNRLFVFLLLSFKSFFVFWMAVLSHICLLQIFSSALWLIFYSLVIIFHRAEVSNFNEVQLINSFFHRSYLWCCITNAVLSHYRFFVWFFFSSMLYTVVNWYLTQKSWWRKKNSLTSLQ